MKKIITFIFNITTLKEENFRGLLPNSQKFIPAKKKKFSGPRKFIPPKNVNNKHTKHTF